MAQEVLLEAPRELLVGGTVAAEPTMVVFTDEKGLDIVDDVELLTLNSATLGAIVARRC